jgi:predicted hydrocarbon binding protein
MIELEMQILSDRREGLLVELGRLVVSNGFSLIRQRLAQDSRGAWLTLLVRGPAERQLVLEEALATHSRVISFEASLAGEGAVIAVVPAVSTPLTEAPLSVAATQVAPHPVALPDVRQVENVLPQMAHDYPRIFPWLVTLENAVSDDAREPSLQLAGRRTGAWVYKRDYALGAKLPLLDAVKRIAMPALRGLATVDQHGDQLHIRNSAICSPRGQSGCKFFSGYLEGLLGDAMTSGKVFVRNLHCRSHGAADCVLEISH